MDTKEKVVNIETTTLERVPENERKSWGDVALIQAGVYICVPSLLVGGLLASGMSLKNAIISGILGYVISVIVTVLTGIVGVDLHVPTCVVTKSSFGENGARIIISTIFAVSCIGWFAVQNNVCGSAFSSFMATMGIDFSSKLAAAIWGIIMLVTAVVGIDSLKWLNKISVPALVIIMGIGCYMAIKNFGTSQLNVEVEATMSIVDGIVLTASFLGVGMACAPDFTRYQKSRGGVWASSFIGIIPPGVALLIVGAILTKIVGENDLSLIMCMIGLPLLGTIVLILATWTTNTTNAYTAGINMVMLFNTKDDKRAFVTGIAGIIGTALAVLGLLDNVSFFFDWLGYLFLPTGGVMVADYWIIRKGLVHRWGYCKGFNWAGVFSWLLGTAVSIWCAVSGAIFLGFATSAILYAALYQVLPKKDEFDLEGNLLEK
ncbi:purine-cytosine permease family protein [Sinanaerobacter sp. ZZT-01]|uniref:purine-cytosine permease family protein n=1 Tax=Sinanaerobacter sp. ZZT-01 TaxID=3111540 RepID=UPI002D78F8DD|nr:cytosine permease [Sinanaerobacter sp. ZZT-01]WRR92060.1 cytosine permease [Sinanaerobacter sp. ZZT-01]